MKFLLRGLVKAMKSKLNYLIGMSLNRKINTKWFLVANIIIAIVIVGVINIDSIITFFGGDISSAQNYTE